VQQAGWGVILPGTYSLGLVAGFFVLFVVFRGGVAAGGRASGAGLGAGRPK
jgi:hypothetical protein